MGPPQRRALADRGRYLRGRHGRHAEQVMQRLGRVERRVPRIMGVKIEKKRPVRVVPGGQAGGTDGQRGLSYAGHAFDDRDPGLAAVLPGQQP
jgi:hypothetical protein